MTGADFDAFGVMFRSMATAFTWKGKAGDFQALLIEYRDSLSAFTLEQISAAVQRCRDSMTRFPKIADIKSRIVAPVATAPDVRWMSASEEAEFLRAERLVYDDEPCDCLICQGAGATHLRLRYVPDQTDDGDERAFCQVKGRIVTPGHWAHGYELIRWYAARETFMTAFGSVLSKNATAARRLRLPVKRDRPPLRLVDREPGEEG